MVMGIVLPKLTKHVEPGRPANANEAEQAAQVASFEAEAPVSGDMWNDKVKLDLVTLMVSPAAIRATLIQSKPRTCRSAKRKEARRAATNAVPLQT